MAWRKQQLPHEPLPKELGGWYVDKALRGTGNEESWAEAVCAASI